MSLLLRVKDAWSLPIEENALIMIQAACPEDEDWWEICYMYTQCILRHKHPQHLPHPYLQVLEDIRSTTSTSTNTSTNGICRFYATITLAYVAMQRHDYTTAIQYYKEMDEWYPTVSVEERNVRIRAIGGGGDKTENDSWYNNTHHNGAFVNLLTSTETESVGVALDREIQTVQLHLQECYHHIHRIEEEKKQRELEQQKYNDMAEKIWIQNNDPNNTNNDPLDMMMMIQPPNDLFHLWKLPKVIKLDQKSSSTSTNTSTKTLSLPFPIPSDIMEQVRKLPSHPKEVWLLECVEEKSQYHDDDTVLRQVFRLVGTRNPCDNNNVQKDKQQHQRRLIKHSVPIVVLPNTMSSSSSSSLLPITSTGSTSHRIQQWIHLYATACIKEKYRPACILLDQQVHKQQKNYEKDEDRNDDDDNDQECTKQNDDDAQDPQLLYSLALMGCVHVSMARKTKSNQNNKVMMKTTKTITTQKSKINEEEEEEAEEEEREAHQEQESCLESTLSQVMETPAVVSEYPTSSSSSTTTTTTPPIPQTILSFMDDSISEGGHQHRLRWIADIDMASSVSPKITGSTTTTTNNNNY